MLNASGKSKYNSSGQRMQLALFCGGPGDAGKLDLAFSVYKSAVASGRPVPPAAHVFENLVREIIRAFDNHRTLNGSIGGNDEINNEVFVGTGGER
jgi:hypothetical protein